MHVVHNEQMLDNIHVDKKDRVRVKGVGGFGNIPGFGKAYVSSD